MNAFISHNSKLFRLISFLDPQVVTLRKRSRYVTVNNRSDRVQNTVNICGGSVRYRIAKKATTFVIPRQP